MSDFEKQERLEELLEATRAALGYLRLECGDDDGITGSLARLVYERLRDALNGFEATR